MMNNNENNNYKEDIEAKMEELKIKAHLYKIIMIVILLLYILFLIITLVLK